MSRPVTDLARLSSLTQRYAELSKDGAGLATLWGGLLFLMLAGMAFGGGLRGFEGMEAVHGFKAALLKLFRGGYPLSPTTRWIFLLSPVIWFLGWRLLVARGRRGLGRVTARPEAAQTATTVILAATCLVPAVYFALRPWLWGVAHDPVARWSVLALGLLGAGLTGLVRREASSEGTTTLLILVVSGITLVGHGVSDVFLLLGLPYLGLAVYCIVRGGIRFVRFRQVVQELGGLGSNHGEA